MCVCVYIHIYICICIYTYTILIKKLNNTLGGKKETFVWKGFGRKT